MPKKKQTIVEEVEELIPEENEPEKRKCEIILVSTNYIVAKNPEGFNIWLPLVNSTYEVGNEIYL